jgi:hypothetical protein
MPAHSHINKKVPSVTGDHWHPGGPVVCGHLESGGAAMAHDLRLQPQGAAFRSSHLAVAKSLKCRDKNWDFIGDITG